MLNNFNDVIIFDDLTMLSALLFKLSELQLE